MFCLNDTMRYYLCPGRTDMRKGISSLCGVVHEKTRSDVRNGDVFIFIGSSRKLMKLLHAEDGGMVMYVKRLEAGRFKLPEYDENTQSYQIINDNAKVYQKIIQKYTTSTECCKGTKSLLYITYS